MSTKYKIFIVIVISIFFGWQHSFYRVYATGDVFSGTQPQIMTSPEEYTESVSSTGDTSTLLPQDPETSNSNQEQHIEPAYSTGDTTVPIIQDTEKVESTINTGSTSTSGDFVPIEYTANTKSSIILSDQTSEETIKDTKDESTESIIYSGVSETLGNSSGGVTTHGVDTTILLENGYIDQSITIVESSTTPILLQENTTTNSGGESIEMIDIDNPVLALIKDEKSNRSKKVVSIEKGLIRTDTRIKTTASKGHIEIEIPQETQLFYAGSESLVSMSIQQPEIVTNAPESSNLVNPLETVFWGDSNASIEFRQKESVESVTFTLTTDALQVLEVGETVLITTSQDGINWSFHGYRKVIQLQEKKAVVFDTTHLTYFNIGKIEGDFIINSDDTNTASSGVTLTMDITGASLMKFGNTVSERDGATRQAYASTQARTLTDGSGVKTVYAGFQDSEGETVNVEDQIIYNDPSTGGIATTLPVTGGLTLHFDSSASGAITTTAFGVQQWNDLSGNGYHARQESLVTNQPDSIFDTDVDMNIIDFNGDDDYLSIQNLNYDNTTSLGGILVCTVFKSSYVGGSYNNNWAFLDYDRSEFFNFYLEGDGDIGFSYASSAGGITDSSGPGSFNDGERHVSCAGFDGSATNDTRITGDGIVLYNQNRVATSTVLSDTTTRYGFIGDGSEAGSYDAGRNNIYYEGSIAEIVYYEQAHTTTDQKSIECYLGNKWGVTVAGCDDDIAPIASVQYTPETETNGYVSAVLVGQSEPITITNNDGNSAYLFSGNGSFTFTFQDSTGNTGSVTATVDRIVGAPSDTNQAPVITSNGSGDTATIHIASGETYITTVTTLDSQLNIIGEYGQSTLSSNIPQSITYHEICEPVIVATHRQEVDNELSRVPRITSKSSTGFDIKVDNSGSSLLVADNTPIDWVVMASGSHSFNGVTTQAGSSLTSTVACRGAGSYNGSVVSFDPFFVQPPVVLHTISSNTDTGRVFSHINGNDGDEESEPSVSEMSTVLHRSYDTCTHGAETIDWIAFERNHTQMDGGFTLDATRSDDSVACCTTTGYPVEYFDDFETVPSVTLTSQLGEDGGDGSYAMIHEGSTITTGSLGVTLDENGPGADRNHTNEIVSLVTLDKPSGLFFEENIITYSISGGVDSGHVFIDPLSGELSFVTSKNPNAPDDQNTDGVYEVIISACDSHCNSKCDVQTLFIDIDPGDICIESPSSYAYSGTLTVQPFAQQVEQQFSGYFTVNDTKGSNEGWYTTLAISPLSGAMYGEDIDKTAVERYATGVDLLSGDVNNDVVLATGWTSYRVASGTITFIERLPGPNSYRTGTYGAKPFLRFTIPAYLKADTYEGEIYYTLYEN